MVGNGAEALSAIAQLPYDLVLMDCQMPEMDGYQATRELRQRERARGGGARRLPVVAMTANAMAGDREQCLEAGMDDYVAKPVRVERLLEILARWLEVAPAAAPRPAVVEAVEHGTVLDVGVLRRIRDEVGDERVYDEVVAAFRSEAPTHIAALAAAVAQGEGSGIRRAAHKLKGSCQTMGAVRLARTAVAIEEAALAGRPGELQALADGLAAQLAATLAAMAQA
jgi:CheY-like chemotaxis protein